MANRLRNVTVDLCATPIYSYCIVSGGPVDFKLRLSVLLALGTFRMVLAWFMVLDVCLSSIKPHPKTKTCLFVLRGW